MKDKLDKSINLSQFTDKEIKHYSSLFFAEMCRREIYHNNKNKDVEND